MGFLVANERAIGFDDDFVGIAIVDYGSLLTPGMELQNHI